MQTSIKTSSSNSSRCAAVSCFIGMLAIFVSAHAAVRLDKLNACAEMSSLFQSLANSPAAPISCRSPLTYLERAVFERTKVTASQACLLPDAPSSLLTGFSCIRMAVQEGSEITCFRAAESADIAGYKTNSGGDYISLSNKYVTQAGKCSDSNGDSSSAVRTMFPPILAFISDFEFGFVSGLGRHNPSDAFAIHGYGSVDPSLAKRSSGAIEFFSIVTGAQLYKSAEVTRRIGEWSVAVDDDITMDEAFNSLAKRNGAPLRIDSTSFTLTRQTSSDESHSTKLTLLKGIQRKISEALEDEGFSAMSETDLAKKTGKTSGQIVDEISRNAAFGMRRNPFVKLSRAITALINEEHPPCTKNHAGAMAAYLFAIEPVPEKRSDYGKVALMLLAMGACGRSESTATRSYERGLVEGATDSVYQTLEQR